MQDAERKMTEAVERICPYCQHRILDGEQMVQCSQCGVPHHEECWKENEGCTVYGCKGWALWPGLNLPQREHRTFEPVDLTELPSREFVLVCPVCKSRVTKGLSQCGICGYDLPRWMMGRYIVEVPWWGLLLLGMLVLDIIAFGIVYYLELEVPMYLFAAPAAVVVLAAAAALFRAASGPWWYRALGTATGGGLFIAAWLFRRLFRGAQSHAAAADAETVGRQMSQEPEAAQGARGSREKRRWRKWVAAIACLAAAGGVAYGILVYLGVL